MEGNWGLAIAIFLLFRFLIVPYVLPPTQAPWGVYVVIFGAILAAARAVLPLIFRLADISFYAKETGNPDRTRLPRHRLLCSIPWWGYAILAVYYGVIERIMGG